MNILIESAQNLKQPSVESTLDFENHIDNMVGDLNQELSSRKDIEDLIGPGNLDMMKNNHSNQARFLLSIFTKYNPEVLVESVVWVYRAYRSHGFKLTYWPAQLDLWVSICKKYLSEQTFNEVYPFFNWLIVNQAIFVKVSDEAMGNAS